MVRTGCAPCPGLVRGQLHGTERSCGGVGSRAHGFQAPQEVALTPGAWGGGGIKPGVQGRKLFTRRAKDRVVPYLRSHPCAPPLGISCLPCPPESCMLPTPSIQESEKVTHLAGKTTRGKPSAPSHPSTPLMGTGHHPLAHVKCQCPPHPEPSPHPSQAHK